MAYIFQPPPNANPVFPKRAWQTGGDTLAGIGQALMSQQASPYPVSPFPAIAQGLQYGQQMGRQRQDDYRQQAMDDMAAKQFTQQQAEFTLKQEEYKRQQKARADQAAAVEAAIATLSPEDQQIARANPDEFLKHVVDKQFAQPKAPINIGGVLYDPDDPTKVVADHSDVLLKQKIAGRPVTNINTNLPPEQNAADKELGKLDAQAFTDIQTAGMQAQTTLAKLDRLAPLLAQVGTGKYTGTMVELKKGLKAAGIDPEALGLSDNTAVADAAKPIIGELTLSLRNPAGGAGMPGAMSDADRNFLQAMVPNLETDPDAVPIIIEFNKRLAKRSQEVAKVARDYRAAHNGHIDAGFYGKIQEHADKNPLFTEADQMKIDRLGTGAKTGQLPKGAVDVLKKQGLPDIYLYQGPNGMYWGDQNGQAVQ